jgi:hypothetical protein
MKNLLARTLMLSVAIVATAWNSAAHAAFISVPNAGFETVTGRNPTAFQSNIAPDNWVATTGTVGTFMPSIGTTYNPATAGYSDFLGRGHGNLLAFTQGGGTFSQTLAATYEANTVYTFSVLVGDSYETVNTSNYELRLRAGPLLTSTLLNTTTGVYPVTSYTVTSPSPAFVTFDTSTNPSVVGQAITLQIFGATGASKTFDNVTLEAVSAVPEPSTFALLGLGMLGFIGYRRSR